MHGQCATTCFNCPSIPAPQAYDQSKVQNLLHQLCDEASTIPLFLKSVAAIEVGGEEMLW
jgi:hypothetical protein